MQKPYRKKESDSNWPSWHITKTLKQFGVDDATKNHCASVFHEFMPEGSEHEFFAFCLDYHRNRELPKPNLLILPLDWNPTADTVAGLKEEGYTDKVIALARDTFIVDYRNHPRALINTQIAFTKYCRSRYTLKGSFQDTSWKPGKGTLVTLNLMGYNPLTVVMAIRVYQALISRDGMSRAKHAEFVYFVDKYHSVLPEMSATGIVPDL